MSETVLSLTQALVAMPSETTQSNAAINDFLQEWQAQKDKAHAADKAEK